MSDPTVAPQGKRSARTWLILVGLAVAVVAIPLTVLLVLRARAARDWPDPAPPAVKLGWPGLPQDPKGLQRLKQALSVGKKLDRERLDAALRPEGPPAEAEPAGSPKDIEAAHVAVRELARVSGLRIEPWAYDAEPDFELIPVFGLVKLRMLRAWQRAAAGDEVGAATDLAMGLRVGLLIEQGGPNLLVTMVGLAVSDVALRETNELLDAYPALRVGALGRLAVMLRAAVELPAATPVALTGECHGVEALLQKLGDAPAEELFAKHGKSPAPLPPGVTTFGVGLLYDAKRTVAESRRRCRQILAAARQPAHARTWPTFKPLMRPGSWNPGPYLDNPVGRILLEVSRPNLRKYVEREDRIRAVRVVTELRVALLRHLHRTGSLPQQLEQLVPSELPRLPDDPLGKGPPSWDPTTRTLASAGAPADEPGDSDDGDSGDPHDPVDFLRVVLPASVPPASVPPEAAPGRDAPAAPAPPGAPAPARPSAP